MKLLQEKKILNISFMKSITNITARALYNVFLLKGISEL